MINLIDLYKKLKLSKIDSTGNQIVFSACQIPDYPRHRLAKDKNNFPSLLIATEDSNALNRPSPIKLEHLEVLYDVDCRISHNGSLEEGRFTVICCTEQDQSIQEYFLRIGGAVITALGKNPAPKQVAKAVSNLVELFRVMHEFPRKSVQGLWAELFLISVASEPTELLRAWHRLPDDKYDFSWENQRIETKSATSKIRQHHFSLEQLNPTMGVKVLVASMFVDRIGSGTSLVELAETVRSKIKDPELLFYLEHIIGLTLGSNWKSAAKDRFNYELAKKSIAFYSSEAIPCVNPDLPKGISDVHFMVDLTDTPVIDRKLLESSSGIFKAALSK